MELSIAAIVLAVGVVCGVWITLTGLVLLHVGLLAAIAAVAFASGVAGFDLLVLLFACAVALQIGYVAGAFGVPLLSRWRAREDREHRSTDKRDVSR